ncbi:MAG: porin family protein [Rheinheimera sp.]|nr:porin family protein [Rheinheimera sp.]
MLKRIIFTALLITTAAQAADQEFYVGVAMHRPSLELSVGPADVSWDLTTFSVLGGYQFHPNFAIEGRIATGTNNDSIGDVTDFAEFGIDRSYSVFAKASYELGTAVEVYGLAGYDHTKYNIEGAIDGFVESTDISESGLAYGAGMSYALTPAFKVALEYLVRPDLSDDMNEVGGKFSNRGLGLTATYKF